VFVRHATNVIVIVKHGEKNCDLSSYNYTVQVGVFIFMYQGRFLIELFDPFFTEDQLGFLFTYFFICKYFKNF